MSKQQHNRGYRIVIVPEDGRESRTISMGPVKYRLIQLSLLAVIALFFFSIFVIVKAKSDREYLKTLKYEMVQLQEKANRVEKIEANLVDMDRYLRYIRQAMLLTGDDQPPALEDFVANDSLKRSYENIAQGGDLANIPTILPVIGGHLSKPFMPEKNHNGIDYSSKMGTVIRATARGLVVDKGFDENLGNYVVIDHGNGFTTKYAHCKENPVEKGQSVERGEIIGTVGNSGKFTDGPHLHYEIRKEGKPVDPQQYIVGL